MYGNSNYWCNTFALLCEESRTIYGSRFRLVWKADFFLCPFTAGALTHTARQVMWFQNPVPDLKDKQASNCETGRVKSPAWLLLHTNTLTYTHAGWWKMCMDGHWRGQCEPHWYACLLLLLSLHTYVQPDRDTNRNKFFCHEDFISISFFFFFHNVIWLLSILFTGYRSKVYVRPGIHS